MEIPLLKRTGVRLLFILALATLLRFLGLGVKQLWLDEILQLLHSSPATVRRIFPLHFLGKQRIFQDIEHFSPQICRHVLINI